MAIEQSAAVVLRSVDFSETSRIVTLLTREFGKVGAMAKGGRRLKGSFDIGLDLLSVCRICLIRKPTADLDLLTEARLERRFDLRASLETYYTALLLSESVDGLTQPHDPHPELYDLTVAALERLAAGDDARLTGTRHLLRTLALLGFGMGGDVCGRCGEPVSEGDGAAVGVEQAGVVCARCRPGESGVRSVGADVPVALGRLSGPGPVSLAGLDLSDGDRRALWWLATGRVESLLGRRLRVASLLRP